MDAVDRPSGRSGNVDLVKSDEYSLVKLRHDFAEQLLGGDDRCWVEHLSSMPCPHTTCGSGGIIASVSPRSSSSFASTRASISTNATLRHPQMTLSVRNDRFCFPTSRRPMDVRCRSASFASPSRVSPSFPRVLNTGPKIMSVSQPGHTPRIPNHTTVIHAWAWRRRAGGRPPGGKVRHA